MNIIKNHFSAIWLLLVAFPLIANAQNNHNRWDFSDYYPKNYFFDDESEDQEYDELPRSCWFDMTDGAQWIYEHKTNQGFQAHLTNCMPGSLRKVFLWLVNMSKLNVSYAEDYL